MAHYDRFKGKRGLNAELIRLFGVNKNAIRARIKSKNTGMTSWGAATIFTNSEETRLRETIFYLADAHFALPKAALMKFVGDFAESIGKSRPKEGWYRAFMRRNPEVSLKIGTKESAARYQALTRKVVDTFYDLVEERMAGVPRERVFILDETGLDVSSPVMVSTSFSANTSLYENISTVISFFCRFWVGMEAGGRRPALSP